ncbi:MAG: PAS fold domain protein [Chloroflexi bacterium]|nr:MAG: PAS fold domain protein [Chloroflexota bacterium]MBA4376019.1 diguanylate cyclase [Anaerolinea sp.]
MDKLNWINEVPFAITVCDKEGIILEMNEKSALTFAKDGGMKLLNTSMLECHPEQARMKILEMLASESVNVYTIEKNGIKKLIYQCPWYDNGHYGGLVELSLEIPIDMPHFVRG